MPHPGGPGPTVAEGGRANYHDPGSEIGVRQHRKFFETAVRTLKVEITNVPTTEIAPLSSKPQDFEERTQLSDFLRIRIANSKKILKDALINPPLGARRSSRLADFTKGIQKFAL